MAAYGLLADCNSAALVDRDGSLSWLCLPRYDSPAVFSRILDPSGGHFSIRPTESYSNERRYLPCQRGCAGASRADVVEGWGPRAP